jgi:UTP--glucose-1-phosphate uridylyltransferase
VNTPDRVTAVLAKAEAGGARAAELAALRRRLQQLGEQQAGLLPGQVLEPLADLPCLDGLPEPPPGQARDVLGQLAVVKLNGGLGTSMGLSGPKSLLQVKPGTSFLDVIAMQVLALRERYGARLPLVLMNSAATRGLAGRAAPLRRPARAWRAAGLPAGPRAENPCR